MEGAGATVEAIERGERRLKPRELMEVSSLLGRQVSDLLQGWRPQVAEEPAAHRVLGLEPTRPDDKPFSSRYCVLAFEAWQREELSEGQLARILCTDRVGAREAIERFQAAAQETKETRVRRLGEDGE